MVITKAFRTYNPNGDDVPLWIRPVSRQDALGFHQHEFVELAIILSGRGIHQTRYDQKELGRGTVLAIPKGGVHAYQKTEDVSLINILFEPETLPMPRLDLYQLPGFNALFMLKEEFFSDTNPYPTFILEDKKLNQIEPLLNLMDHECQEKAPGWQFTLLGTFMVVLAILSRAYGGQPKPTDISNLRLGQVLGYLNSHFAEGIRITELHHMAYMSKSTFSRSFFNATGLTPKDYLVQIRLSRACSLLADSEQDIGQICYQVGIPDSNYFARIFKKHVGITPLAYRKKNR